MLDEIKEFFQSFLVPQLEGIRGDIRRLDTKLDANVLMLDAKIGAVDTKVESYRRETLAEMRRVEEKVDTRLASMEAKVDTRLASMEEKLDTRLGAMDPRFAAMDARLVSMDQRLDAFRRELLAEIRAAGK